LPDRWRAPSGDATRPRSHPGWRGLKIKEQVRGLLAEGYEVYTVDDVRVEHEADESASRLARQLRGAGLPTAPGTGPGVSLIISQTSAR
jgi:hypothetical protein